ncbi:hypothetical protein ACHAWF_006395 [Thalassiosira exigua]
MVDGGQRGDLGPASIINDVRFDSPPYPQNSTEIIMSGLERRAGRRSVTDLLTFLLLLILVVNLVDQHSPLSSIVKSYASDSAWDSQAETKNKSLSASISAEGDENLQAQEVEDRMFNDFTWSRYCKAGQAPCIAILSATHHGGIVSTIDPRTLKNRINPDNSAQDHLRRRILVREAYCAIHSCDVIIDYNDYTKNKTMWLQDHGKGKVGKMPPHWNKVASIKRWLSYDIFDAVVWLDMDTVLTDFATSLRSMYDSTPNVRFPGQPQFIFLRQGEVTRCVVDSWWYFGTGPGCRYFKYPQNHMGQTQDLDMPWLWYSVLKCTELYSHHQISFECLNQCNGPKQYVDHMGKDPDHDVNFPLWIGACYDKTDPRVILNYTGIIHSGTFAGKHLNYELQFGARLSDVEAMNSSISVHRKDYPVMVDWLNRTEQLLLTLGCTQSSCRGANRQSLAAKLSEWGP